MIILLAALLRRNSGAGRDATRPRRECGCLGTSAVCPQAAGASAWSSEFVSITEGDDVGKQARMALLLAGSACLMAVMVEWIVSELQ